jgi:CheY-like chemotaxis protein
VARAAGDQRLVKVLDFGVAKIKLDWATSSEAGGLTRTGAVLGSPLYMAPEQARGSRAIDDRADLWSLGVVLYRALAGRVPNQEVDGLGELIIAICTQAPPPIREVAPWVPKEVAAIVARALTLDPRQRFQSAADLLSAIRQIVPTTEISEAMLAPLSDAERTRPPPRAEARAPTPNSLVPSGRGRGRRVLVVEDNEMNMDMLSRRLERKGFTVLKAVDGERGVALCRAELPDLVLMDISLPGMDGCAATRALRDDEATRQIPIIALTAHALAADRERALAAGCDDYETKPVEFVRLLGKIEAMLKR